MMWSCIILLMMVTNINALSSPLTPFTNYTYSTELLANVSDLWWSIDTAKKEITFELHMKTTGWIALGISPAGGMPGADIGVGWVNQTGSVFFQDRYAYDYVTPVLDNTTTDWFALQGREEDGWTAIRFQRLLDTCDSMDVPIKSGTNILIFAYGLVDPTASQDITYHENRRGSRIIPLQSYAEPPSKEEFIGLDTIEFRLNNYSVPTIDTIYYCKIFKVPDNIPNKRHAIAREILLDSGNEDILHHLILSECDPTAVFDDNNLPYGYCDDNSAINANCTLNIAMAWAVGGDTVAEYPDVVGYPIGHNFSIKYYLLQIHYDNSRLISNRTDSSGIRLYLGNTLRQYDLGCLTFGMLPSPFSLAIPPNVNSFIVNSYCTANASLANFPDSGTSLWTKLVRNKTAVQYLFDAESYDFNHQFEHQLPQPIKIYPGDEFATRCVYDTMNKNEITLGGEKTTNEMCFLFFSYYPRMDTLYTCADEISPWSWAALLNVSTPPTDDATLSQWLLNISWTSDLATQWQNFYDIASQFSVYGRAEYYNVSFLPILPAYTDLSTEVCDNQQTNTSSTVTVATTMNMTSVITTPTSMTTNNLVIDQATFILLVLIPLLTNIVFNY